MLGDEDFYIWRTFRLLSKDYSNVLKFSRSNVIDYSLKNVILIVLKAFSQLPHSKIENLRNHLQDVNNLRDEPEPKPETPIQIESDQESGEIHLNGKEDKFKLSPKRPILNKKAKDDGYKKHSHRDAERNDKESHGRSRVFKNDRNDRGENKSQSKGAHHDYKRHKYY